jgi:hypothetical protein
VWSGNITAALPLGKRFMHISRSAQGCGDIDDPAHKGAAMTESQ